MEGMEGVRAFGFSSASDVTDDGLASISKHKDLEGLTLQNGRRVTDDGLQHLDRIEEATERSNLWNCKGITDDGLKHLRDLKQLKSLNLGGTKVTEQGIERLQQALPECKIEK